MVRWVVCGGAGQVDSEEWGVESDYWGVVSDLINELSILLISAQSSKRHLHFSGVVISSFVDSVRNVSSSAKVPRATPSE